MRSRHHQSKSSDAGLSGEVSIINDGKVQVTR
jgi:hypothetical protein